MLTHNEQNSSKRNSSRQENPIYADYNGSAPLDEQVKKYLIERIENGNYSNPNASHKLGFANGMNLEKCRGKIAKILGCKPKNILFNSGSTEGISTIFHTLLEKNSPKKLMILSGIEHSAIYNNAQNYIAEGFECIILKTKTNGIVDFDELDTLLKKRAHECAMVSIMAANNETGVIQPYKEIARLCNENNVPYFCDTTQFIGKTDFHFLDSGIDYAITSGHKFGAMTGTGIILAKDVRSIKPLVVGGGQEKGIRGGTQHYLGLETLPIALESYIQNKKNIEDLNQKRIWFEKKLKEKFPGVIIIAADSPRLATTTYVSYPGLESKHIQRSLQAQGIFVTTSSACSDSKSKISQVLTSMGVSEEVGLGVIRIA